MFCFAVILGIRAGINVRLERFVCGVQDTGVCEMSIWDSLCEEKLMDWGIVDRHRKRAYAEGFRDGVLMGCILVVSAGSALALYLK